MAPRFDAIIFDLDGTLADTFGLIVSSWNAACREPMGRTYSPQEVIARFGPTEAAMLRREVPPEHYPAALRRFLDCYERNHATAVTVFDGVPEMLSALGRHKIPMGVMTGKGRDTADITLRALGWTELFESIVTGDEITRAKPDPQGVLRVAMELHVEPQQCAFVGDAPADIQAGKAAGMSTVWAGWHPVYAQQVRAMAPDHLADAPGDVLSISGLR